MNSLFAKLPACFRPATQPLEIDRVAPLLQLVPTQVPPVGLLARIEDELDGLGAQPVLQARPRDWRPMLLLPTGFAGAIAGAAGFALLVLPAAQTNCGPLRLAALQVEASAPGIGHGIGIDLINCGRYLHLNHAGVLLGRDTTLELWLIPHSTGIPVSLGLIAAKGSRTILPVTMAMMPGDTLAISREPETGSPKAGPTGPVLGTARIGDSG